MIDELVLELKREIPGFDKYAEYRAPKKGDHYIKHKNLTLGDIGLAPYDLTEKAIILFKVKDD